MTTEWVASLEYLVELTVVKMKTESVEWTKQFSVALMAQFPLYDQYPLESGFLLHLIGICVYYGVVPQGAGYGMEFIMTSVRHHVTDESIGCAAALGTYAL